MNENNWKSKWSKDQIKAMLLEQFQAFGRCDTGIERDQLPDVERMMKLPHAIIVSGLRRVGKSTLIAQLARRIGEDRYYYINFEDDRFLGFQVEDVNYLYQIMMEVFGERFVFIVDEIQNIPGWERFVRRFMDMGVKFCITGSNASLLSSELGDRLTGRYAPVELLPFSFTEFLRFRGYALPDMTRMTTRDTAKIRQYLNEYLASGGIPEALKYPDMPLMQTLYNDVLYRDIAARYRISDIRALKELAFFIMSNPSCRISFNKLKSHFRLGSVNTIKNYIEYMENSWLIFTINIYDCSVKRQQIAPKKVYCIDTGLSKTVGFSFSPDTGRMLENMVYLSLRRKTKEIYYLISPGGFEVDFFLPETRELIQVVKNMENPETRQREIRSLTDAMHGLKVTHGLILSDEPGSPIEENGLTIEIQSFDEWMMT